MKRKRFSEEQIIAVLKENEAGAEVDDLCRRHGISTATFYGWRRKYVGMDASEARCIDPVKSCSCYKGGKVAMSETVADDIKRWTAKRKSALVIEIIRTRPVKTLF